MTQPDLEPLPLTPIFVERVWGGANLAAHFGKRLPENRPIGESWEAADIGRYVSCVDHGPHAGRSLRELAETFGSRLSGKAVLAAGRLPLLFKLIDAREDLSVQVHPCDDDVAPDSGDRGKEEAWYILAAEPGARLVHGLRPGVAVDDFFTAVAENRAEECLQWHRVAAGEVYYIPPGTLHAIGKGIVLAEIQQSSDTTYRIYDWGRVGLDGKPRQLHIEEAREVSPGRSVSCPYGPERVGTRPGDADLLVEGEHFRLLRYDLAPEEQAAGTLSDTFAIVFAASGDASLECRQRRWTLSRGQTWLLPAELGPWSIATNSGWTGLWQEPVTDA